MSLPPLADDQERHDCEVRTVAQWPRERRQRHYDGVRAKRGEAAAARLCDDVRRYWREHAGGAQ